MPAPTPYVSSITIDAVADALGAFLAPFVNGATIIRAQVNRVAPPAGPFVELTELFQVDLETPISCNDGDNLQMDVTSPKRIDFQVDFYGPSSGDQCAAVKGVFRTSYAVEQFPDGITPLYCSDGHQTPLITAEAQYASRWTLTVSLQYNPAVVLPQQSADTLALAILEALK